MYVKKNLLLWVAVFALALPLMFVGTASAKYQSDGAVADPVGGWIAPTDGICVVGLHADGTLDVADGITNKRDCDYLTSGTMNGGTAFDLRTMTASAACATAGATGNDGAKHSWTTSSTRGPGTACLDSNGNGVSLKDLDKTQAMCQAKGGTWNSYTSPAGVCVAYGWQFRGQDASGTPLPFGATGVAPAAAGTGFCYTSIRTGITVTASCSSALTGTDITTSNSKLGYSMSNGNCLYAYGTSGVANAALTKADGTVYAAAGDPVDLTTLTQGQCLAYGASWANGWGFVTTGNTYGTADGWTSGTGVKFDQRMQALNSDEGCLHCHSTKVQYNGPAERWKDSYLKTGHKNMLRAAKAGNLLSGPDGVAYTTDGTNAINFMTSSDSYAKITVGGVDQNLYYVYGDWMAALPSVVYGKNGYGSAPTGTTADNNGYSCYPCHTTGASDKNVPGIQGLGTPGYAGQEPNATFPGLMVNANNPKWDLNGITCGRCHNATVPSVSQTQINSSGTYTGIPTSGGMGALASGTGRTNLCFGCHGGGSMAKVWPSGATQYDPTLIATGVSHGANAGRDFNGHILGQSFLNSPHALYSGVSSTSANGGTTLNALGEYDLHDPNGVTEYGSIFKGYTCWQSPTSNSPAKTKADGTEIKTKADCESIYGVGSWRADQDGSLAATSMQGTCTTCHDVHNSLFVASQKEAAIRKTCEDCHVNNATTGATDAAAPQVVISTIAHPVGLGTPFDTSKYESSCVVCHMGEQAVANGDQTSMLAHVWRINTDPNYNTFPSVAQFNGGACSVQAGPVQNAPSKPVVYWSDLSSANCTSTLWSAGTWSAVAKDRNAQIAADPGTYNNAVWVDLDLACGQCHGGGLGAGATHNGAPYKSRTDLAPMAANMHLQSTATATTPPVNNPPNGTYNGNTIPTPTVGISGIPTVNNWTVTVQDASVSTGGTATVTMNWGDGTISTGPINTLFSHPYTKARTYKIRHIVANGAASASVETLTVAVPTKYTVTGTISVTGASTDRVNVRLKKSVNGGPYHVVKTALSSNGTYTFSNVPAGLPTDTFIVSGYKYNYSIPSSTSFSITGPTVVTQLTASQLK